MTLSEQAGSPEAGQEMYSHHSWWGAVAARALILCHTAQGQWSGDVLNTAGTIKVERNWKRSFLITPEQEKCQWAEVGSEDEKIPTGGSADLTVGSHHSHLPLREPRYDRPLLSYSRCW